MNLERVVVVGRAGGDRSRRFVAAMGKVRPELEVRVVDLFDWIAHRGSLGARGALVRIDSPERDLRVRQAAVDLGGALLGTRPDWTTDDPARVASGRERFVGYMSLLEDLIAQARDEGALSVTPDADTARTTFDKRATHDRWISLGVSVPRRVDGHDLDTLAAQDGAAAPGFFVKARYGSSAAGILTLRARGDLVVAVGPVHASEERGRIVLHSTRKIRRYTDRAFVARVIDELRRQEDLHVEAWVPKPMLGAGSADLRVVVVDGQHTLAVARSHTAPMTNLHLGGQRIPWEAVVRLIGPRSSGRLLAACRHAASAWPDARMIGLDVTWTGRDAQPVFFEANVFGDHLKDVTDSQGRDAYALQARAYVGERPEARDQTASPEGAT